MIKVLAACGAGVNSSHQIKDAIESEFKNRGYNLHGSVEKVGVEPHPKRVGPASWNLEYG